MNTKKIVTFISALALVIMLLLTAVSQAIFGNNGYFKKEFEKYSVTDNINMEMDDIMYMMGELMDYLPGTFSVKEKKYIWPTVRCFLIPAII